MASFLDDRQALLELFGASIDTQDTATLLSTARSMSGSLCSDPSAIRAGLVVKLVCHVELRCDKVSIRLSREEIPGSGPIKLLS